MHKHIVMPMPCSIIFNSRVFLIDKRKKKINWCSLIRVKIGGLGDTVVKEEMNNTAYVECITIVSIYYAREIIGTQSNSGDKKKEYTHRAHQQRHWQSVLRHLKYLISSCHLINNTFNMYNSMVYYFFFFSYT